MVRLSLPAIVLSSPRGHTTYYAYTCCSNHLLSTRVASHTELIVVMALKHTVHMYVVNCSTPPKS